MLCSVHRVDFPGKITERQCHRVQVVGQRWPHEGEGEVDVGAFKIVDAAGRCDFQPDLRQGRRIAGFSAHNAKNLPINADQTDQGMLPFGPVLCGAIGQMIGSGPDAEVRIERHQRNRRRAERLSPGLEGSKEGGGN